MPTDKHRIAAYLPKEIDEKFQVFKQEREVGDSQGLILLMSEYFGVSQQVTYSSDSPLVKQVEELSSLLNELKSELTTKVGEERISELKSELLSELKVSSSNSESRGKPEKQLDIGVEVAQVQKKPTKLRARKKPTKSSDPKDVADGINILTTTQLAQRLNGVKNNNGISSAKRNAKERNNPSHFTDWSRKIDPEGYGWEFRSDSQLFYKVAHQSEPLA